MSLRDRVMVNRPGGLDDLVPFLVEGRRMGSMEPAFAAKLREFERLFVRVEDGIELSPSLRTPAQRSEAMRELVAALAERGDLPPLRNELYPLVRHWGEEPLLLIERSAAQRFGIRTFGVHVNGIVQGVEGLSIWAARRSSQKTAFPGKLDQLIAGGQPHGLSLEENLIKESWEEAGFEAFVARRARPVGMVRFRGMTEFGFHDDVLFCFDLSLGHNELPVNRDGEVSAFDLLSVGELRRMLSESEAFCPDSALVNIDLLMRHGELGPDEEAHYAEIAAGLRVSTD